MLTKLQFAEATGVIHLLPGCAALAHAEGGAVVADIGALATDEVDLDDVEACGNVIPPEQGKPVVQTTAQQFALVAVDGAHGGATGGGGAALDLAGDKHIALAAYDIELAAVAVAEIAAQYFEPLCPQVGGCYQLAVLTQSGA